MKGCSHSSPSWQGSWQGWERRSKIEHDIDWHFACDTIISDPAQFETDALARLLGVVKGDDS